MVAALAQHYQRLMQAEKMASEQNQAATGTGVLDLAETRKMVDLHQGASEQGDNRDQEAERWKAGSRNGVQSSRRSM